MTRAGIDCSGLTYDAAQQVGITLPRDAADQSRVGAPVTRKALRPGDLVFFGSGARANIHHVAIYIGRGRVLHAPHTGSSVRIDPPRHFPDYWGAPRLVPPGCPRPLQPPPGNNGTGTSPRPQPIRLDGADAPTFFD